MSNEEAPVTVEEMVEGIKLGVQEYMAEAEPDDDPPPVAMFLDGEGQVAQMPLPGHMLATEETKDILATLFEAVIHNTRASAFVMVTSAWMVYGEVDGKIPEVQPSKHPDRIEVINIQVSEPDDDRIIQSRVYRRPGMNPLIGEWEQQPSGGYAGRFVDGVQQALMAVKNGERPPGFGGERPAYMEKGWGE